MTFYIQSERWAPGHGVIYKLCWNKALWSDVAIHVSSFNQLDCFISREPYYAKQKFVDDIPQDATFLAWEV